MLKEIRIIHEELESGEALFLADFFQLIGAYVIDSDWKHLKNDNIFLESIIIIDPDSRKISNNTFNNAILLNKLNMCASEDIKKQYLFNLLNKLLENNVIEQNELNILKEIANIYIRYDLLFYKQQSNYFSENPDLIQQSQDQFVDAYIALTEKTEQFEPNVYLILAQATLAYYTNLTCKSLKQIFLFDTGKVLNLLDNEVLTLKPSFDNVYFLQALLSEIDYMTQNESLYFYKEAINSSQINDYKSYIIYRLGEYYETVLNDENNAKMCYLKAQKINPLEYRIIFKIAKIAQRENNNILAIEYYKSIQNILSIKNKNNYLLPIEYDYLFKACSEPLNIYKHNPGLDVNQEKSKNLLRKKASICPEDIENKAYEQIFGTDKKKKYLSLTKQRLKKMYYD